MEKIERIIYAIRRSHRDMEYLFLEGQCYNFFLILRVIYPKAEAWYDYLEGHIYTKLGDYWYDIRGRHDNVPESCVILSEAKSSDDPMNWGLRDTRRLICKGEKNEN